MAAAPTTLERFATHAPLAACAALKLGPFGPAHPGAAPPTDRRRALRAALPASPLAVTTAIETAGRTARQLLTVLRWWGGAIADEALDAEAAGADAASVAEALTRLADTGLVARARVAVAPSGRGPTRQGWLLTPVADELLGPIGTSLRDPNAVTTDVLARICRRLAITVPSRKDERIDAVVAHFADPDGRAATLAELDDDAIRLVHAIADRGPRPVSPMEVGIEAYDLHSAEAPRYGMHARSPRPELAPLATLVALGIVGLDSWDRRLWIWREAWPLLGRALYADWPSVPRPATAPLVEASGGGVPAVMATYEAALRHWDTSPPAALKNGEPRLAKAAVRGLAKELSTTPATVEIVATTALGMGLLLRNVVATSGRGRHRTVDEAWMADPDLRAAWAAMPAWARWARAVAEWANPGAPASEQLVANRHLVLWELAALPEGEGFTGDEDLAAWMEHRYLPIGVGEAVLDVLGELRALGLVPPKGPVGLTSAGRRVLADPQGLAEAEGGSAAGAVVQADHTIVCPPDLDADLLIRIAEVARLESDAGARIFRVDEDLVTKAVQDGRAAPDIVAFLESLGTTPLPDTVRALVADGAARAGRVRVVAATTVVVTDDPADLARACKLASAKLTAVSPTVATSPLPPGKVRQVLDRKGLAPLLVGSGASSGEERPRRRSGEEAARLEAQARSQRRYAERSGNRYLRDSAERMEEAARVARDPARRLAVTGPIAVTPALVRELA